MDPSGSLTSNITKFESSGSPSLQFNNLSHSVERGSVAYVHGTQVLIQGLHGQRFKKKIPLRDDNCDVASASFVCLHGVELLVIASSIGIQIWSADGGTMKYFAPISTFIPLPVGVTEDAYSEEFMQGIAGTMSGHVFVGTSRGNIEVFRQKDDYSDIIYEKKTYLGGSPGSPSEMIPVSAVAASSTTMVYGNECGDLVFFEISSDFERGFKLKGNGVCCTSIVIKSDVVAAGFSNGLIRFYRAQVQECIFEIAAHSRAVYGLSLDKDANIMASCSEDQLVSIWSFPDFTARGNSECSLISSHRMMDRIITGVAIVEGTTDIIVAAYDDDMLYTLSLQ
jgi:WD40 repeat protein